MFYQGPGSGAFAIFGVVGGLASVAANSSPGEILSKYAEDNGIFIEKIRKNFTESQQHLFVSSFYTYLNYSKDEYRFR